MGLSYQQFGYQLILIPVTVLVLAFLKKIDTSLALVLDQY